MTSLPPNINPQIYYDLSTTKTNPMAYDEYLVERVRLVLKDKRVSFTEKKMMGGLCFMVDEKMCIGLDTDKVTGRARMMARVGDEAYESALEKEYCSGFIFTGRPMKGFVYVDPAGIDMQEDLEEWVQLCLDFNPFANKSKKKKSPKKNKQL